MPRQPRKSIREQLLDAFKIFSATIGALATGAACVAAVLVGLAAAMAVLVILLQLMFVYTGDQARIGIIDKFVEEGVYGQILNATTRTSDYLDLMTELQQANLVLLLCLGAALFIGFVMLELRLAEIVKIQKRLLEIEEETLELRRRPQTRPAPAAPPQRRPKDAIGN